MNAPVLKVKCLTNRFATFAVFDDHLEWNEMRTFGLRRPSRTVIPMHKVLHARRGHSITPSLVIETTVGKFKVAPLSSWSRVDDLCRAISGRLATPSTEPGRHP